MLSPPVAPFKFKTIGKSSLENYRVYGVAEATRSSRQFLELRPKAERIEGGAKRGAPPTVAYEIEFEFFDKGRLKFLRGKVAARPVGGNNWHFGLLKQQVSGPSPRRQQI